MTVVLLQPPRSAPAPAPGTPPPPDGINPGARVAIQTPGGLLSGSVVSAQVESRIDFDWIDNLTLPTGPGGPANAGGPPAGRTTYQQSRRRLDLRVRLDPDPIYRADAVSATGGLTNDVVRRAAARIGQLQTERLERQQMALVNAASSNFVNTAGADPGCYAVYTTAGTGASQLATGTLGANWVTTTVGEGGVTAAGIQTTMARWRAMAAASDADSGATVGTNFWYGTGGSVYSAVADHWTWEATATGAMDVRFVTQYTDSDWHLASGDGFGARGTRRPEDRLREMIRSRMAPAALGRARDPYNPARPGLAATDDFRELRARETLAKVIGEDRFRRFLRDGFVTCRAKSGRTYQIFPGTNFTRVFHEGKEQPRLCVVLCGRFPPTDSLIVRFLMLLNDEEKFRSLAVNQGLSARPLDRPRDRDERPLAELYAGYKREYRPAASGRNAGAAPVAAAG